MVTIVLPERGSYAESLPSAEELIPFFDRAFEKGQGNGIVVEDASGVVTTERHPVLRGKVLKGLVLASHDGHPECERSVLEPARSRNGIHVSYNFVNTGDGMKLLVHEFTSSGRSEPDREPLLSEYGNVVNLLSVLGAEV